MWRDIIANCKLTIILKSATPKTSYISKPQFFFISSAHLPVSDLVLVNICMVKQIITCQKRGRNIKDTYEDIRARKK